MRSLGNWIAFFLQAASLGASPAAFAWDWDGAAWADYGDYLGPIDAGMKAFLQEVAADGVASGRIEGRMGQIGDSITESSAHFRNAILNNITSNQTGHNYDSIRSWIAYSGDQPADANSFYRDHGKGIPYANKSGWKISSAVAAGHPQVAVETGDGVTPGEFAWAILMFGTNDIDPANWDVASWKEEYCAFVQDFIDLGVIPVLSTLPPEQAHAGDGRVQIANDAILDLAGEMNVPWIDYYGLILHFQPVNWHGTLISADGTHPSADSGGQGFSQLAQT
ncbi:MAG TPA: SGNH/GDSL hydrolase family protein, partial [bacterium]|nr:SGNH/GDSL hydrolase family protein [bacterium]